MSPPSDQESVSSETSYNTLSISKRPLKETSPISDTPSQVIPTILILSSSLLFSLMHCAVRFTTTIYSTSSLYVVYFRGLIQTICAAVLIATFRDASIFSSLTRRGAFLVCLRGFLGTVAMLCRYTALTYIPIAIASSLFATTPIFTVILGWLFLGEGLTIIDRFVMIVTTIGALLVALTQPAEAVSDAKNGHLLGVLLALSAAVASSLVFVIMRTMGTKVHFLLTVLTLGIAAMVCSFVTHIVVGWNLGATVDYFASKMLYAKRGEWMGLLGVGCFAFLAALSFNRGAQFTKAGRTGLLRSADIPLNFTMGFLLLGEFPSAPGQLLGCGLIAVSTGVLAYQSFAKTRG